MGKHNPDQGYLLSTEARKQFIFERNSDSPWEAHLAPILSGADLILYSRSEECLEVAPGLKQFEESYKKHKNIYTQQFLHFMSSYRLRWIAHVWTVGNQSLKYKKRSKMVCNCSQRLDTTLDLYSLNLSWAPLETRGRNRFLENKSKV